MEFEITDDSKYYFETAPDDGEEGRCQHVHRLNVHPSIRIGGVSVGRCVNKALPGMVNCYIHTPREAMDYVIRSLFEKVQSLENEICELKKQQ
jgi:hypothetical protein